MSDEHSLTVFSKKVRVQQVTDAPNIFSMILFAVLGGAPFLILAFFLVELESTGFKAFMIAAGGILLILLSVVGAVADENGVAVDELGSPKFLGEPFF